MHAGERCAPRATHDTGRARRDARRKESEGGRGATQSEGERRATQGKRRRAGRTQVNAACDVGRGKEDGARHSARESGAHEAGSVKEGGAHTGERGARRATHDTGRATCDARCRESEGGRGTTCDTGRAKEGGERHRARESGA